MKVICHKKDGSTFDPKKERIPTEIALIILERTYGGKWKRIDEKQSQKVTR